MTYEIAIVVYNAGMPKKFERKCNTCNKHYNGFGKFYCSSKCQPRNYYNGSDKTSGQYHYNWKGEHAGYHAIHLWINKEWGKASECENKECNYPRKNAARRTIERPKRFEWALKRGREYTREREDYYQLCKSCHAKYDHGNNIRVGTLT